MPNRINKFMHSKTLLYYLLLGPVSPEFDKEKKRIEPSKTDRKVGSALFCPL
jgi:hypothetical protein